MCLLEGAVVGEWSLARPSTHTEEQVKDFATSQVRAYNHASHGWFFWNWHDHDCYDKWDMQRGVFARTRLPIPLGNLSHEVTRTEWSEDPWSIPLSPEGSGAASLVSWLGRVLVNPLVGLYDGGAYSFLRRLGF
eukprot:CAMPEP_0179420960 /NCGR_PEP_ID=MMETSP0799-20121207/9478_1 /TAXON_ID=46947 /ORGANISM="Geminigera cryophila, Strain CCMP2564" /LENGTH=133 /DNA_ID=CAMNT_0021194669 /DNA_START=36 /DNA_END=437 /DNA_ORIENTATION=-